MLCSVCFLKLIHNTVCVCLSRGSPALVDGQDLIKQQEVGRGPWGTALAPEPASAPTNRGGVLAAHPPAGAVCSYSASWGWGEKWNRSWWQAGVPHMWQSLALLSCSEPCEYWYKLKTKKKSSVSLKLLIFLPHPFSIILTEIALHEIFLPLSQRNTGRSF